MTDPTERLEHFATNDTAHGGDCLSEQDIIEADDYPLLPETMEREFALPDPAMLAVRAYLSAVKRFGLALQQLGRRCDE